VNQQNKLTLTTAALLFEPVLVVVTPPSKPTAPSTISENVVVGASPLTDKPLLQMVNNRPAAKEVVEVRYDESSWGVDSNQAALEQIFASIQQATTNFHTNDFILSLIVNGQRPTVRNLMKRTDSRRFAQRRMSGS
jgi:hypothetical protein